MIASDIHGSALYCNQMLLAMEREGADRLLLLGDLLYHGPRNDLPDSYQPKEVIRMLNEHKERIFCVRGNCDTEVDQMVLEFPIMAEYALIPFEDRIIFVTHGHHFHMQQPPSLMPGDILLHGHTHVPAWTPFGRDNLYLNPGSVSIPKDDSWRGYMLLTEGGFVWKTLAGTVMHTLKP
ncbi:MAG: phosphodiesterase [Clostridia bacterium]|nr:phosphodiesterase [Clostridia bacterium]